ncbi:MAG TPA: ABC transporter substrate-binding protein [Burkholderiales bacterium]|nr:ABC transporter substrate-binding protein [Burkholderiales bacterium]
MNRRDTLLALLAVGTAPLASHAQQPIKQARIACLGFGNPEAQGYLYQAFKQGMRELGHVEGDNVVFEERWAMGNAERLPGLTNELVALKPAVIVTLTGATARVAQQATTTIPIVFALISDPVGYGLVKSLAHPGGNITGISTLIGDYSPKLLELLLTVQPKLSRVAILLSPTTGRAQLRNLQSAAKARGVGVLVIEVQAPAEIEPAFARMAHERVPAVIVLSSPIFTMQRRHIAELAINNGMASVFTTRVFAEAGGLMGYGPDYADQARRAATLVDKILKGAKPSGLPVEQATRLELIVNLKTARAIEIPIPKELLLRADLVIE